MENSTINPYMRLLQFIVSGFTLEALGKNDRTNISDKYNTETMLTGPPHRPRLQRACGNFSPLYLLIITQRIDMMYEEIRAATPRDIMAFNAVLEPMLISDKRIVTHRETTTAFSGMSHPG